MPSDWKKVIVSGSVAELNALTVAPGGALEVSGSLIIMKNLPTSPPVGSGYLWNSGSFLKVTG